MMEGLTVYGNYKFYVSFFLIATEKTFQRTMVCLADKDQLNVPTSAEKITLRNNSLGEKKVNIPALASADRVKEVLYE